MSACEKCWRDAHVEYALGIGGYPSLVDAYRSLLDQRSDVPCSPQDAAGDYWDETRQIDRREIQP